MVEDREDDRYSGQDPGIYLEPCELSTSGVVAAVQLLRILKSESIEENSTTRQILSWDLISTSLPSCWYSASAS